MVAAAVMMGGEWWWWAIAVVVDGGWVGTLIKSRDILGTIKRVEWLFLPKIKDSLFVKMEEWQFHWNIHFGIFGEPNVGMNIPIEFHFILTNQTKPI